MQVDDKQFFGSLSNPFIHSKTFIYFRQATNSLIFITILVLGFNINYLKGFQCSEGWLEKRLFHVERDFNEYNVVYCGENIFKRRKVVWGQNILVSVLMRRTMLQSPHFFKSRKWRNSFRPNNWSHCPELSVSLCLLNRDQFWIPIKMPEIFR